MAAEDAEATISVEEFAEMVRVTPKTVNLWIRSGMPVASTGSQGRGNGSRIDLKAAVTWYFLENAEAVELNRQRSRLAREQADAKALENAASRQDLVPLSMIEREFSGLLAEIRTNALAIPSKVAPELEGLSWRAAGDARAGDLRAPRPRFRMESCSCSGSGRRWSGVGGA